MQAYLQHLAVPKICFIENTMLFNKDQSKIKRLQPILQEIMAKAKVPVAELNELGQPITITEYDLMKNLFRGLPIKMVFLQISKHL